MWEVYLKGEQDFPEKHYFGVEVRESSFRHGSKDLGCQW